MNTDNDRKTGKLVWLPLFVGFCGLIGSIAAILMGIPLLFVAGFILSAIIGLAWGSSLLSKIEQKGKIVIRTLIAAVVLAPIYIPAGIAAPMSIPLLYGYAKRIFTGPDIVQSVISPDGNFEAYVIESPSIDPPNQSLYIQQSDNIHFRFVAKLPEDIDSIRQIYWSPQSDIVVFRTQCNIFATHLPGYQTVTIPLGGDWTRSKPDKQSTFSSAGPRVSVSSIEFPRPGAFSYQLEGSDKSKIIEMDLL